MCECSVQERTLLKLSYYVLQLLIRNVPLSTIPSKLLNNKQQSAVRVLHFSGSRLAATLIRALLALGFISLLE